VQFQKVKFLIALLLLIFASNASAQKENAIELRVAVASNFAATLKLIVDQYADLDNERIVLLIGSTGKHASQIQYGLEVDVFLAADRKHPELLEKNGFAVPESIFNYAFGRLAPDSFRHLAIANPKLAPYGLAAIQFLQQQGVFSSVEPKLVKGDSVGQAWQFVHSRNADLGLVAFSQVKNLNYGSHWLVPSLLHEPIVQSGVIINDSSYARKFVNFLKSKTVIELIEAQGYLRP